MKMRKHVITILAVMLMAALGMAMTSVAFAAEPGTSGGDLDKPYTYRITVYSGNQGTLNGGKVWTKEFEAGSSIDLELEDLGFELTNKEYYVRGFRVAGHDNDEVDTFQRLRIDNIETDESYELAYGIKGALVAYTVKYVDENGNSLRGSDTYYGMPGDKPVVSYRYVDGYVPHVYNIAGKLSKDESSNVFTFRYTKGEMPANAPLPGNNNNNNNAGNGNTANANPAAAAGARAPGTAGNPAGTGAPGQDGNNQGAATIGDNDTPLADTPGQFEDIDENDSPLANGIFAGHGMPLLIGCAVLLLIIIALILFFLRRRRHGEDMQ